MAMHKFRIGQTVFLQPTVLNGLVRHAYAVTRRLPAQKDGQYEYRIKSSSEPFERVAKESDLSLE